MSENPKNFDVIRIGNGGILLRESDRREAEEALSKEEDNYDVLSIDGVLYFKFHNASILHRIPEGVSPEDFKKAIQAAREKASDEITKIFEGKPPLNFAEKRDNHQPPPPPPSASFTRFKRLIA
jgi:hypothetical protein